METKTDPLSDKLDAILAKLEAHEGKFSQVGKDLGRLRGKLKGLGEDSGETPAAPAQPPAAPRPTYSDSVKLARATQGLKPEDADFVLSLADSHGLDHALAVAGRVARPESGPQATGEARSQAQRPARARPQSLWQLNQLKATDPEFHAELMADPGFDVGHLRSATPDDLTKINKANRERRAQPPGELNYRGVTK